MYIRQTIYTKNYKKKKLLRQLIKCAAKFLCRNQGRNQDFAKGGRDLKMGNFCDAIFDILKVLLHRN